MSYEGSREKGAGSGIVMRKWILVDEEEKKVHKIWYVTLYNKLSNFLEESIKNRKSKSFYIAMTNV